MRDDLTLAADVVEAADRVASFVAGMTREEFLADAKSKAATVHEIIIMGEAASQMTPAFRAAHPEIPWRDIVTLRNLYIHAYHRVDYRRVWRTAVREAQTIRNAVAALLPAEEEEGA